LRLPDLETFITEETIKLCGDFILIGAVMLISHNAIGKRSIGKVHRLFDILKRRVSQNSITTHKLKNADYLPILFPAIDFQFQIIARS
jgi:hypothetical protein